mgnify:FL=1
MSTLEYTVKYEKNKDAILSPTELRELYLYGINLKSRDGTELPNYTWWHIINDAQEEIEKFLAIHFRRQLVTETLTYLRDDYLNNLPILNTSYPVVKVIRLLGLLSGTEQIRYPIEWSNYYESSDHMATRRISIVPSGASVSAGTNVLLIGVMAQLGIRSLNVVPNYWTVQYLTGWAPCNLPHELVDVVGKLAAIQVLSIYGDLVLSPGLSGGSLSIDGLSQSYNTVVSQRGGAFSGRIAQYLEDIKVTLERLERSYKGINFAVL